MNKNIWKAILAVAVVFLVAAMPISGMIVRNGIVGMVKADESAVGVIRNVAPTVNVDMTGSKSIVYNSGSDTITFNASVIDRNREDDIGIVDATPSTCWFNISSATTGNFTNYTIKIAATSLTAAQANMYNHTAADGILVLSSETDDSTEGFQWTCPTTWGVGTDYIANLTITDLDGETCNTTVTFEVKAAVKIIGVYNYTGLRVDNDSPFYWNFTTTDPGVLNVTSGNWSYTGTTAAGSNYGYNNATARLYSFWLVVNNTAGVVGQCFNVSFSGGFTSSAMPGTTITTSDVIYFESYNTTNRTYTENTSAYYTNSNASWVTDNAQSNISYIKDGNDKYGISGDGTSDAKVMFRFDKAGQNFWIRFMIDIPATCRASTDYTCAYSVTS